MRGEWLYYPHGQKVGDEGIVDRGADEQHPKKTRERQMHNKEATKTPSHLMRLVDLIFFHLPWYQVKWRGGVWAENEGENHVFFPYTTFLLVIVTSW